MPCWIALPIPPEPRCQGAMVSQALAFTPRVSLDVPSALLLEVQATCRLFGGEQALLDQVERAMHPWVQSGGLGPTAHAACAALKVAQRGVAPSPTDTQAWHWHGQWKGPLTDWLGALPHRALPGWELHADWLDTLGVHTLAQLNALPRRGLTQRAGAAALKALDQAFGKQAEVLSWLSVEETFMQRREWLGRIDQTEALLVQAQPLLEALCQWLSSRQAGVLAFGVRWQLDHRRGEPPWGEVVVRLAQPSREPRHLQGLLAEHLRRVALPRPVEAMELQALQVVRTEHLGLSLFSHEGSPTDGDWMDLRERATPTGQREEARRWLGLLERLSARLGPEQVRQGRLHADHRPEQAQRWCGFVGGHPGECPAGPVQTASSAPDTASTCGQALPLPAWLINPPRPLAWDLASGRPQPAFHGPLQLLNGPHRVEAGWWDTHNGPPVRRDYHLAHSPGVGLLWVYQDRHAPGSGSSAERYPWFLQGLFA